MAVRRVRRIVRRIDPWTVLKVSLVFNAIAALIFVLGTWVTWSLVLRRGIPERIVDIFESLTLTITIEGELYFRIVVLLAIIGAILMTAFMTLGALLYNLIADLVGGIEIAVLEETYRPASTRTRLKPASVEAPVAEAAPFYSPAVPSEIVPDRQPLPDREMPVEVPAAAHADGEAVPVVAQEPLNGDVQMEPDAPTEDDGSKLGEGEVSRVRTA